MRSVPPTLAARLAAGTTQTASAWIVRRTDGVVLGFTDHDDDLTVDGVRCVAATGLDTKDMSAELGLAPGGGEVLGALQAAAITEADIASGAYDGADVRFYLCDCEDPFETVLLDTAIIGEIRRDETSFVAELRGMAHRLNEETGRIYQQRCDADFGDARCGVDLARPGLSGEGRILSLVRQDRLRVEGLGGFAPGALTNGTMRFAKWPSRVFRVRLHAVFGQACLIDLWNAPDGLAADDRFTIAVGCDKTFETCASRFGNAINFRGFPHMTGNEIVLTVVQDGDPGYDGGSLFNG